MNTQTYSAAGFPRFLIAGLAGLAMSTSAAFAGGTHKSGHGSKAGEAGKPAAISHTVKINAFDTAFSPASLKVRKGETVRFIVTNTGDLVHEFNIGTVKMHKVHQQEMMKMMESGILEASRINHKMMGHGGMMQHNDPNSVLLEPGETKEVIWKFTSTGTLKFACNVPGHYESGMVGNIKVLNGHRKASK